MSSTSYQPDAQQLPPEWLPRIGLVWALRAYAGLLNGMDDTRRCQIGQDRLAWRVGLNPGTVVKALHDLKAAGAVVAEHPAKGRRATVYYLPREQGQAPPQPPQTTCPPLRLAYTTEQGVLL